MLNLITGSAERSSPGACDHLSGSFFSLSFSGSGLFSPSPYSQIAEPVLSAESHVVVPGQRRSASKKTRTQGD